MSKLDGFFCNEDWDITFDKHIMHALSSSLSDHCPLLLANDDGPRRPRSFRFENFWTNMPGFQQVILEAWNEPSQHHDPFLRLFHKLKKTSQKLRVWSRTLFSNAKVQLHMALEIILRLDEAQDVRILSPEEADLRKRLKRRVVGLAVLERTRKRQSSRITNIKEGDANTRYFHLRINGRRRKNLIHRLKQGNDWVTDQDHKKNIVHSHFSEIMKRGAPRPKTIKWAAIPRADHDLSTLGDAITEEEVKAAIFALPSDKAPGPDGFTGKFFKSCWEIIKDDILLVINSFSNLQTRNFHWLNSANIALVPKKDGAEEISDFRPISLIHAVAKLIAKILATRLAPHMNDIVSIAQSAFIKKRSTHDNFMYVRNSARRFHRTKKPMLLFKLDIRKAFDSVRWDYLLEMLSHHGFPTRFRDWVSALLSSASSRVLLNGIAGDPIKHGCGLRQGDPLSPLLFVLAIDPLHHILNKATTHGKLHPLPGRHAGIRASLYADLLFSVPLIRRMSNSCPPC